MKLRFTQALPSHFRVCSRAITSPVCFPLVRSVIRLVLLMFVGREVLAADGWIYSQRFLFNTNSGNVPGALIEGSDGSFYGITRLGGSANHGTFFRVNKDGTGVVILRHVPTNLVESAGTLMEASDGVLYGTAEYGGTNGLGSIFRLNRDGSGFEILHHFEAGIGDGHYPVAPPVEGPDGLLYGTTRSGGSAAWNGTAYRINKAGGDYTLLHHFGSVSGDGSNPVSPLLPSSDGRIYGVTSHGGTNTAGTVFRMDRTGDHYELLHQFSSRTGDADIPDCLLEGSDGELYGSSGYGGISKCGAVFRLNRDGSEYALIWNFTNCLAGGNYPFVHLVEGGDGSLYGTTGQCGAGYGSVFQLSKDGSAYTELWRFRVEPGDGEWPVTAPIAASDGLYGFTQSPDQGAIYRLGPVQHLLSGCRDVDGFRVRFGGMPGQHYELQRSVDFTNWTTTSSFEAPLYPFLEQTDSNSSEGRAFYRSYAPSPGAPNNR